MSIARPWLLPSSERRWPLGNFADVVRAVAKLVQAVAFLLLVLLTTCSGSPAPAPNPDPGNLTDAEQATPKLVCPPEHARRPPQRHSLHCSLSSRCAPSCPHDCTASGKPTGISVSSNRAPLASAQKSHHAGSSTIDGRTKPASVSRDDQSVTICSGSTVRRRPDQPGRSGASNQSASERVTATHSCRLTGRSCPSFDR